MNRNAIYKILNFGWGIQTNHKKIIMVLYAASQRPRRPPSSRLHAETEFACALKAIPHSYGSGPKTGGRNSSDSQKTTKNKEDISSQSKNPPPTDAQRN